MSFRSLPQTILCFLILIIVFWSKVFFVDTEPYNYNASTEQIFSGYSFISKFIFTKIQEMGMLGYIITMFATIINAFYISRIIVRFNTNTPKSFISMVVFLCLISVSSVLKLNVVNQIIIFFILSSCEKQIFVQLNYKTIKNSYYAAFSMGMVALLAPIYYTFLLILLITHIVASTISFREITATIFGLITPLFLSSYFIWLADGDFWSFTDSILGFYNESFLRISFFTQDYSLYYYLYALVVAVCSVVGILTFIKYNSVNSTKFEYTYYLFLFNILLGLGLLTIFFSAAVTLMPIILIGLASIISMLIVQTRKFIFKVSLIVIFIAFSIYLNFINV